MEELDSSLSITAWYVNVAYSPFRFLYPKNVQNKWVDYIYIDVMEQEKLLEHVLWRGVVFHYEWYFDYNSYPFIHIIGRIFLCSSIMMVLLKFIISYMLIIWSLLWSKISIFGTGCFTRNPLPLWIVFNRAVWLMLYKFPQKIKQLKNGEKQIECIIYISFHILLTCLQNQNVSSNWWTFLIQCRPCSNSLNFIIFNWWYFTRLITIIVRVWYIIISFFRFCCSWKSLKQISKNLVLKIAEISTYT